MAQTKDKNKKLNFEIDPLEMVKAGLHFGHKTSSIHPKIKPFLFGARGGVHIFDVEKTSEKLKEALEFIQTTISEGKTMLLVGTKIQARRIVEETAKECGLPYVVERWLGGTFTNFETLKKRIDYFKDLENKKLTGELEKYTKKERADFDKELEILRMKFEGLRNLKALPDVIFLADMKKDILAVREAKIKGLKIIGIADTNIDPTLADYPILANDDAMPGIRFILDKIKEVVLKSKPEPELELSAAGAKSEKKAAPSLKTDKKK
jgi:small subunit ribosomal protein S2